MFETASTQLSILLNYEKIVCTKTSLFFFFSVELSTKSSDQ